MDLEIIILSEGYLSWENQRIGCRIFFFKCYLFIYCWLCWVFVAAYGFSLVAESGGNSQVAVCGPLIAMASLIPEHGLKDMQASVVGDMGFIALQHVESSQTRNQACISCIGR